MARKGILSPTPSPTTADKPERPKPRAAAMMPRGAVGALQSSLTKLQENAVQDIDTALIDDAGVEDRLGLDTQAQKQLVESLQTYGQQVPVLLRPHSTKQGRYEIVYGRRRLQALRKLGLPVKAMVRQLDDHALVMAQGQENTSRQDLSFIEKASFAAQLEATDYDRQTIAAALSIDLPMVSRMLKVGNAFDLKFLRTIGSAPGIGRDRWMQLVKRFENSGVKSHAMALLNRPEFRLLTSDERFEAIFERTTESLAQQANPTAKKKPKAAPKPRTLRSSAGGTLGDIKTTRKGVTLTLSAATSSGFDTWFDSHAEDLLNELHARFTAETKDKSDT